MTPIQYCKSITSQLNFRNWQNFSYWTKNEEEKNQITRITVWDITTNLTDVKKNLMKYDEHLFASKLTNSGVMDKFVGRPNLLKLTQEETYNQNRPIMS